MYLLEHDAKQLLATHGIPLPAGSLVEDAANMPALPPGPWVVKAQVAVGGRGKAGGIRKTTTESETLAAAAGILRMRIRGLPVRGCRIEQQISGAVETYLSLMIDAAQAGVRVMLAPRGGVDIEALSAQPGLIRSAWCDPEPSTVSACVRNLASDLAEPLRSAFAAAGSALAVPFFAHECVLLEINPLFVKSDGTWFAGDAKMITDDTALFRQPRLRALLASRAAAYPEAQRKQQH